MSPRLTIVLPLKGRHLFTLRFLWHANAARLPYHFLIADGQVHPQLAGLLENSRATFPELDIEYARYPNDKNFSQYFRKMADAMRRVRTPYVMLADNDDFLCSAGIERSLEFLDTRHDYVCCGGGLAGFSVYSDRGTADYGLVGRFNKFSYRYTIHDRSLDLSSDRTVERLRAGARNWWSYYAVFRTEAMATIWREVEEIDFSDLQVQEIFFATRTLSLGKALSDASTISYLRQYGTSLQTAYTKDWVAHVLRSRFTSDFNTTIDRISAAAAAADGADKEQIAEILRSIYEEWLREFLRMNYGPSQTVKQWIRDCVPGIVVWLKTRRRSFTGLERASLFSSLARDGASPGYITAFRQEIDTIENVLKGPEFAKLIAPHVRKLGMTATSLKRRMKAECV
jgi:glycosyltransferase domain-containing protein